MLYQPLYVYTDLHENRWSKTIQLKCFCVIDTLGRHDTLLVLSSMEFSPTISTVHVIGWLYVYIFFVFFWGTFFNQFFLYAWPTAPSPLSVVIGCITPSMQFVTEMWSGPSGVLSRTTLNHGVFSLGQIQFSIWWLKYLPFLTSFIGFLGPKMGQNYTKSQNNIFKISFWKCIGQVFIKTFFLGAGGEGGPNFGSPCRVF